MKILEALYAYKGQDEIVATTKNIDYDQESIIRSTTLDYCQLRRIDRNKGYCYNGEVNVDLSLMGLCYIPKGKYPNMVVSSFQLYQPSEETRGNPELVHFLTIDGDIDFHSPDLFNLSPIKRNARYLLGIMNSDHPGFDPVNENELTRLASSFSPSEVMSNKKDLLPLLEYIVYAFNNRRTLYIYYEPREYQSFQRTLFLALKLLPKELANQISFVTAYGGQTQAFDIVGIPFSSLENAGVYEGSDDLMFIYPSEQSINKNVANQVIEHLFETFDSQPAINTFYRYIADLKKEYTSFDEYLNDVNMYLLLFGRNVEFTGDEVSYFHSLIQYLKCVDDNFDFIFKQLPPRSKDIVKNYLALTFKDNINKATNDPSRRDTYYEVIDLLINFINKADDEVVKVGFENCLINYLFNFNFDSENSLTAHIDLINYVFENRHVNFANEEFIGFIYHSENKNMILDNLKRFSKDESSNHASSLFYKAFLNYVLNHYTELDSPKTTVTKFISLIKSTATSSIDDLLRMVFDSNGLSGDDKYTILHALLSESRDDKLSESAIKYFSENELFVEAISHLIKFPNPNVNFNNLVIDNYLDIDKVSDYTELKQALNKLYAFEKGSKEFIAVKERLINHHLDYDAFDITSITSISIYDAAHNEKPHLDKIVELFAKESRSLGKKIVGAIEEKRLEIENFGEAKELEDELSDFRIQFVLRILGALPEKVSKNLIKKNLRVKKFIDDHKYSDIFSLKGENYAVRLNEMALDFFHYESNNPNANTVSHKRDFAQQIVNAQNTNRFNIRNITSFASAFIVALIFGAVFLAGAGVLGGLAFTLLTHNSYLTTYIAIAILNGVASFAMTFVNMQNRGRKPVYLISIVECLAILILSLGLFVLFVIILGGM